MLPIDEEDVCNERQKNQHYDHRFQEYEEDGRVNDDQVDEENGEPDDANHVNHKPGDKIVSVTQKDDCNNKIMAMITCYSLMIHK